MAGYVSEIISAIKINQSEIALLELLKSETDRTNRTLFAEGLCKLAITNGDALQQLREMISSEKWDRTMLDLDADVVSLFTMVGHQIPELPRWRANLEDEKTRRMKTRKAHKAWFERSVRKSRALTSAFADGLEDDLDLLWALPSLDPAEPMAAPVSIRRSAPKVGRNDPCPCGSGKKHKKCCGK
jgi:uncharacterized protein YecA (UPF0149 family)